MRIRPQIMAAMIILGVIGVIAMFTGHDVTGAAVTGIGMLGLKLLEGSE